MMSKSFDDDARFDRLVDGELAADEYRALVASLDEEPGGWRRCALAFLEAQALAGEIGGVRRGMMLSEDDTKSPLNVTAIVGAAAPKHKLRSFRLTTILAMAASFLVAFGLGLAMPRWFSGAPGQISTVGSSPDVTTVAANAGREPGGVNQIRHAAYKPIGNLQLVVDGPGGVSTPVGDVPVYDGQSSAAEWLNDQRPALSPEVLQTLRDRGHKIDRQIEYVPVRLEDGRDVIVPIERYQIRPPSRLPY
jgi:hypothetical protein